MITPTSLFSEEFLTALAERTAEILADKVSAVSQPRLMTTAQAAEYLACSSESALRQKRCHGFIPDSVTTKIGGSVYYDRRKLDEWLDNH